MRIKLTVNFIETFMPASSHSTLSHIKLFIVSEVIEISRSAVVTVRQYNILVRLSK